jgi:tryptophan synthase alpha chain
VGLLRDRGKKALVIYIVAGDPDPSVTVPLMHKLVAAGVDVIELGVPFSDPEAEGPVIQQAHERALRAGTSLLDVLQLVAEFRKLDQETPVVLMGYLNPVEKMGYENFAQQASTCGIDGTIIVNLPPEEATDLSCYLEQYDIESVYLLAPTTTPERAGRISSKSRGFVYYVSLKGTTGAGSLDTAEVSEKVRALKKIVTMPLFVGFGIKNGPTAAAVAQESDGVVVGSVIVDHMALHENNIAELETSVVTLVKEIRSALDALVV